MDGLTFTDRLKSFKLKLPSTEKVYLAVISLIEIIVSIVQAIAWAVELALNIFIVLCAVEVFKHGIVLYMLAITNNSHYTKVLIEIGAYLAVIISSTVVRNIIRRYF
jgi:hypothetical protein